MAGGTRASTRRSTRQAKPPPEPEDITISSDEENEGISKRKTRKKQSAAPVALVAEIENDDQSNEGNEGLSKRTTRKRQPRVSAAPVAELEKDDQSNDENEGIPKRNTRKRQSRVPVTPAAEKEKEDLSDDIVYSPNVSENSDEDVRSRGGPKQSKTARPSSSIQKTDFNAIEDSLSAAVRSYEGPFKRHNRTSNTLHLLYGPKDSRSRLAASMIHEMYAMDLLPLARMKSIPDPWISSEFPDTQQEAWKELSQRWKSAGQYTNGQKLVKLSPKTAKDYLIEKSSLIALIGPYPNEQREVQLASRESLATNPQYLPVEGPESRAQGWVINVGGLVLCMDWAPKSGQGDQILAMCISPHSDQQPEAAVDSPLPRTSGFVQFWKFRGEGREGWEGMVPSANVPGVALTLCVDWGRCRRVRWCPVPAASEDSAGLLAILCEDGRVYVFNIPSSSLVSKNRIEKVENPLVTLPRLEDDATESTCFAWAGLNRIVVGYADGTVGLWSLFPRVLLSRHAAHYSYVMDIATGYPSKPLLVASSPLSGPPSLIDLSSPSSESTEWPGSRMYVQPNLLQWCDHLQGFFSIYPSSGILVTNIVFSHHRYFPHGRTSIDNPTNPTCLAIGTTHPIMLTGLKDGSVWACNPVLRAFATRAEKPEKIPILEHEYRPSSRFLPPNQVNGAIGISKGSSQQPRLHGASRIIEGGKSEPNVTGKMDEEGEQGSSSKGKKKAKAKPKAPVKAVEDEEDKGPEQLSASDLGIVINHEPFTRITAITWNPNPDFGRWAAIAMGSGLVRIIDLGVE